jgi:putative hydrolase of the HAD superfamily
VLAAESDLRPTRDVIEALAIEYECRVNPTWPMPDLLPMLAALRQRGIKLGIISNAQFFTPLLFEALTDRTLAQLGFDEALCVYSFDRLEAKPSTALYERAAARLRERENIQPAQTLYLGNDMLNDITPARQVGFRTALFAGDKRSLRLRSDDLRIAGIRPDRTITALASLPPLLS